MMLVSPYFVSPYFKAFLMSLDRDSVIGSVEEYSKRMRQIVSNEVKDRIVYIEINVASEI